MVRKMLLCLLLLLVSAPLVAEEPETETPPADGSIEQARRITAGLKESLSLTEEQQPQVEAVMVELVRGQREAIARVATEGEEGGLSRETMAALQGELRTVTDRARGELAGVLTDVQLAGFDRAMREERVRAVAEAIVGRLDAPLELSREQHDTLVPIFAEDLETRARRLEQMKSGGRTFGAARVTRDTMQRMQEELDAKVEPVLTPEQMATYRTLAQAMREDLRGRMRSKSGRSP